MKKLLIALAIIMALVVVAFVGVGFYVYRQVKSTVTQFAELSQLPTIESQVRVRGPYTPPSSDQLTEKQLASFMRVQAQVKQRLGERFAEFERKYKALADKKEATIADVPAIIAAYRDMATTWLDAKRTQVEALNDVQLSLDEYRWIRHQAYRALGVPYMDLDVSKIIDAAERGASSVDPSQLRGSIGPAGPEANQKLIATFKKQLEANVALASFGL
jgi:hypothetical protein